jgi:phage shock protein A
MILKKQGGKIMGIFTRFRDIINSNINAMLDKAEDPEKLIKLIIREMEDTLVELKASCASVMANCRKIQRQMEDTEGKARQWEERAALAVTKGRDDLAREALLEKRQYFERAERLGKELAEHNALVGQYQEDIKQLEDKLQSAREKQRVLVQRQIRAKSKMRAQEEIRRIESTDAILKFEAFENRIERMEAEADLVNFARKTHLESEFDNLMVDEDIEKELQDLKSSLTESGPESIGK